MGIFDFFRSNKKEEPKRDGSSDAGAGTSGTYGNTEPKADTDASQPDAGAAADSTAPAGGDAGGGGGDGGGV